MQTRFVSRERVEALARKALLEGGCQIDTWRDGLSRRQVTWDLAMECSWPREVEIVGRWSADHKMPHKVICVILRVRCRKCDWCRDMRRRFWTGRAMTEYEMSPRTFMGTLTCSLDEHIQLDAAVRTRLRKHGVDFDELPSAEKFGERCVELGAHITLWLKRVRAYGAQFRYLMIAEPHNSEEMGQRPHVHMLIHEQSEGSFYHGPLGWVRGKDGQWHEAIPDDAPCRRTWPLGFTRFERVSDARSARYVCKYVSKTAMLRIRASKSYGDPPPFYAPKVHSEEIISHVYSTDPCQAAAAGPLTNGAAYQAMEWTDA